MALDEGTRDTATTNPGAQGGQRPATPHMPMRAFNTLTAVLDTERDQWIIWIVIAFGAGAALYFSRPVEPAMLTGPTVVFAILCIMFALPRHTVVTAALGLALSLSVGFTAAKLKTEWVRAPVLKSHFGARELKGTIEEVEPRTGASVRLTIKPASIADIPPSELPQRIRVTISGNLTGRMDTVAAGDSVSLRARLSAPSGPVIPGGYDFARYSWFKGLGGVGYALSPPKRGKNQTDGSWVRNPRAWIKSARRTIGRRIQAVLSGETGAIANALITGERGAITEATNDAYRGAGLYHILSISGMHMAIMAGAVFFLLRTLLALIPKIALTQPIKKWAAVGAILGAFAYLMISGGAFATIRSFIMILIMFVAILLDRPALALRNVAFAALVILIIYPESILNPGFQMSFAAVTALIAGFEAMRRWAPREDAPKRSKFTRWIIWPLTAIIGSTVIASAAVTPFAIYHFHNAQHYAVLANLVAMPACNVIVMPAALATLIAMPVGLESVPLQIMGFGIDLMTKTALWVSKLPGSVSNPPALAPHVFATIITGGLILLIVRQIFRVIGLALIAIGIAMAPGQKLPDVLVGRDADLIAIQSPRGALNAHVLSAPPDFGSVSKNRSRSPPFELGRWMEHYGDVRPPKAALHSRQFKCDRVGCTARKRGVLVALPFHPSAIREDCARAQILIINTKAPRTCKGPQLIIDKTMVRKLGAHAIYIDENGEISVKTVAQSRGRRPWVRD